jgi:hypothetical protein
MEKAAKECQPAERPAMLRRWLAALRMQSGEEPPTADAADAATAPDTDYTSGGASAGGSGSSAATDVSQDWDSLHLEKSESRDAAQAGAEQDSAAGAGGSKYGLDDAMRNARLFFYEEASEQPLSFRDVILRSRALEFLVNSYVATPAATSVETSLLTEFFQRLLMVGADCTSLIIA